MPRPLLLVLPLLSLVSGCKALDAETVEYQPGKPAATIVADRDAKYALYASEGKEERLAVAVAKGELVGFRWSADGSLVAIAGSQMTSVSDERYVWKCRPEPAAQWERFASGTRDTCEEAAGLIAFCVIIPLDIVWCAMSGDPFH